MKTLIAALLIAAAAVTPALAQDTVRTSARLPVFDRPSTDGDLLFKLNKGERIALIRCTRQAKWCLFAGRNGEPAGWVQGGYLIGIGALTRAAPFEFLSNPMFTPSP